LGALLADVPHTRPISITGLASDDSLVDKLGLRSASYGGPTGITGVLHSACAQAGMPSASLWAAVPHYVAAAPNPKAALALVRRLEGLVGVSVDAGELERAAVDYERQVGLAVQSDPDVQAFVERLEQMAETADSIQPEDLPSGDLIAREFQRPGGPRTDGIERKLHVIAQLGLRLRDAGLVVDQLVAAALELVDAIDAAANVMRAEREGEGPLEPAGLG